MTLTNSERSQRQKVRDMEDIYNSLAFNLHEYLEQADSIVQRMFFEMTIYGVPERIATAFLQEKFLETIKRIANNRHENGWENGGKHKRSSG